jgi:predicted Zn-dependent peptidase
MLSTLLSQGSSSRLNKVLVDEQQAALQTFALPFNLENPGAFLVLSLANLNVNLSSLEASTDAILGDLQTNLISEQEYQKLQNQIEDEFISTNNSVAGIAENLANYEMYFNDANLINTELERYKKVSREDLRNAAKKYFNKNNRVVLYWLPETEKP